MGSRGAFQIPLWVDPIQRFRGTQGPQDFSQPVAGNSSRPLRFYCCGTYQCEVSARNHAHGFGNGDSPPAATCPHFGTSAGWADARRRDAGDMGTSSRSGNDADARPPPRPGGLPSREFLISYSVLYDGLGLCKPAAKCEVIVQCWEGQNPRL